VKKVRQRVEVRESHPSVAEAIIQSIGFIGTSKTVPFQSSAFVEFFSKLFGHLRKKKFGQGDPTAVALKKTPATSIRAYYRPELDALRFLAFLCVFMFHRMDYVPTDPIRDRVLYSIGNVGPFGVSVFFLLSAFLITELLLRERQRSGRIHIKAFYLRRLLRIWPLYFAAFFGLALLNRFVPGVGSSDPLGWLAFTFFAGNWYILRHGWIAGAVDPLWSISVEEQFYVAIPLLAAFAGRRAVAIVSGVLLIVAYVTVLLYALDPVAGDNGEWTNSFVQFQFFPSERCSQWL
jgi:peptidoglycan/LPS O-acetylase OafA/YrhL